MRLPYSALSDVRMFITPGACGQRLVDNNNTSKLKTLRAQSTQVLMRHRLYAEQATLVIRLRRNFTKVCFVKKDSSDVDLPIISTHLILHDDNYTTF